MSVNHILSLSAFIIFVIGVPTNSEKIPSNDIPVNMRDLKEREVVLEIALLGVKYITDHYGKPHELIRVFEAVKNSSNPTSYRLSMEVESNAEKRKLCDVEALEMANKTYELLGIECIEKNIHGLVGARKHIKVTDMLVKNIVNAGFEQLSKNFTASPEHKLGVVYIDSASVQVVAGLSYKVKIAVGLYENKEGGKLLEYDPTICIIDAWLKPWESNDAKITVKCENDGVIEENKSGIKTGTETEVKPEVKTGTKTDIKIITETMTKNPRKLP